jgi:hypothetical protein
LKLLQDHVVRGYTKESIPLLSSFISINGFSDGLYSVELSTGAIKSTIISSLLGTRRNDQSEKVTTRTVICVRIPHAVLMNTLPGMIQRYEILQGTKPVYEEVSEDDLPAAHSEQVLQEELSLVNFTVVLRLRLIYLVRSFPRAQTPIQVQPMRHYSSKLTQSIPLHF